MNKRFTDTCTDTCTALTATTTYQSFLQVGVLGYMAPEVHRKRAYGAPVDVFAFGVMLWETLLREVPWDGFEPLRIRERVCDGERPTVPARSKAAREHGALFALARRCWAQDAAARPDMGEVCAELDSASQAIPLEVRPSLEMLDAGGAFGDDALDSLLHK